MTKQNKTDLVVWKLIVNEVLRFVQAGIAGPAVLVLTFLGLVLFVQIQDMFFAGIFNDLLLWIPMPGENINLTGSDILKIYSVLTLILYALSFVKKINLPKVSLKLGVLVPLVVGSLILGLFYMDGYDWGRVAAIVILSAIISATLNITWITIGKLVNW